MGFSGKCGEIDGHLMFRVQRLDSFQMLTLANYQSSGVGNMVGSRAKFNLLSWCCLIICC